MALKEWILKKFLTGKLPNWVYRLIGNRIAKILKLKEEGQMSEELEGKKPIWKSKTFISDVVTILIVIYTAVQTTVGPNYGWTLPNIPEWVYAFLAGIGIYGRKVATQKV